MLVVLCHCIERLNASQRDNVEFLCSVTYGTVFPIILAVTIFTNLINVAVLLYLQQTTASTPARFYLLWLAVSHCLTCIPLIIGLCTVNRDTSYFPSYVWAFYASHIGFPLYNGLNFVCVYIIVGLSLDRYFAVCQPHNYSQDKEFKKAYSRVVVAFLSSFLFYLPYCFYQRPNLDTNSEYLWYIGEGWVFHKPLWKIWALIVQVVHRIIPTVLMVGLNSQILLTLHKMSINRRKDQSKSTTMRNQKDRQLVHLLLALSFVFIVTNIPSAVMKMSYTAKANLNFCSFNWSEELARSISNCVELTGYCFDFVFYFVMNTEYRRALKKFMNSCQLKSCRKGVEEVENQDSVLQE